MHAEFTQKQFPQTLTLCGYLLLAEWFIAPITPKKNTPLICALQIEQWREHHYPSFVHISSGPDGVQQRLDPSDPRTTIALNEQRLDAALARKRRLENLRNGIKSNGTTSQALSTSSYRDLASYVGIAAFLVFGSSAMIVWAILKFFGEVS